VTKRITKHYGHDMSQRWRAVQRTRAWTEQDSRCKYCLANLKRHEVTADHMHPRSAGGMDEGNIVGACYRCNQAKGSMTVQRFRKLVHCSGFPPTPTLSNARRFWINLARVRWRLNKRADQAVRRLGRFAGVSTNGGRAMSETPDKICGREGG